MLQSVRVPFMDQLGIELKGVPNISMPKQSLLPSNCRQEFREIIWPDSFLKVHLMLLF